MDKYQEGYGAPVVSVKTKFTLASGAETSSYTRECNSVNSAAKEKPELPKRKGPTLCRATDGTKFDNWIVAVEYACEHNQRLYRGRTCLFRPGQQAVDFSFDYYVKSFSKTDS